MLRPEKTPDQLIVAYLDQFSAAGEWDATIRIKWILNSALTMQTNEDELVLRITREKNKTL